jgi:hypothetical protein
MFVPIPLDVLVWEARNAVSVSPYESFKVMVTSDFPGTLPPACVLKKYPARLLSCQLHFQQYMQ